MEIKVKKIIAREGLIILAIILLTYLKGFYHVLFTNGDTYVVIVLYGMISLFLCTTYLLMNGIVRFIVWAIKALKNPRAIIINDKATFTEKELGMLQLLLGLERSLCENFKTLKKEKGGEVSLEEYKEKLKIMEEKIAQCGLKP